MPRLPIIEPERVAAPPLAITLTDVYRYRLAGREPIGGAPLLRRRLRAASTARAPLFRGRAWIAADDFGDGAVSAAAQTGLRGPIVSSEQVDEFAPDAAGPSGCSRGRTCARSTKGAAHRTPIHRLLSIDAPRGQSARLRGARAQRGATRRRDVMLRDTPEGYPLPRAGSGAPGGAGGRQRRRRSRGASPESRRAASARSRSASSSIRTSRRPLPFAGLSYVDFNLFGTGTQFNGFFGGTYGQLAFSVPSLGGTRWQLAGRAFGIASSYNDRAFVQRPRAVRRTTSGSGRRRPRSGCCGR